jgi:hypothetical protein
MNLLGEIKSWVTTANATSFSHTNNGDTKGTIKPIYLSYTLNLLAHNSIANGAIMLAKE